MLIVAVPRTRIVRREIMVFQFPGITIYEAFKAVDEWVSKLPHVDTYGCTPLTIALDQVDTWVRHNVHPNWLERLRGDFKLALYTVTEKDIHHD